MMSTSVLLSFVLGELAVRALYGSPLPFRAPQPRYVAAGYGYKLESNQQTFIGDRPLVTNAHGFRDEPWLIPKPSGRRRVLIVGDSMPFGYHVDVGDTFGRVLERELRRSSRDVEVRVAAISGWDTWNELQFLEAEGIDLEPDLVILCVFINDFKSAFPSRASDAPGMLVNTRPRWSRWMSEDATLRLKQSALIFFVRSRFEWAIAGLYDRLLAPTDRQRDIGTRLMNDVDDPETRTAMEEMQSMISRMHEVVRGAGADLTIAFMPNLEIFAGPPRSPNFLRTLQDFARAHDIGFVDPTEDFRGHGRIEDLYLRPWDNAHFSALGHRLAARSLLREVSVWLGSEGHAGESRALHPRTAEARP